MIAADQEKAESVSASMSEKHRSSFRKQSTKSKSKLLGSTSKKGSMIMPLSSSIAFDDAAQIAAVSL